MLTKIPNIGKILEEKLKLAGIQTYSDLKSLGAENAFIRLKTIDQTACINSLYAIEGAIQVKRWHGLSHERKQELLDFFKKLKI
ncbi:MAG: TfoX/Sxy family protein, partial [Bacteroidales bacterium]|nr:TfoX/Sxy family protein [Bacteroidales bacterium]